MYAMIFLLIFAIVLVVYGAIMQRTGDASMIPFRARHSVTSKGDVRRVGRIVMHIGGALAAILVLALLFQRFVLGQ